MPNIVNEMAVREMTQALDGAEGVLVVGVQGLSMPENETLRNAPCPSDLARHQVTKGCGARSHSQSKTRRR